ncbi:hypothetical protein C8Q74DRAFT_1252431 [Fomes fomentarius]|nr:hypothetical protein C8Q74DRAFT_1252431 [Fomes fomentarius]
MTSSHTQFSMLIFEALSQKGREAWIGKTKSDMSEDLNNVAASGTHGNVETMASVSHRERSS